MLDALIGVPGMSQVSLGNLLRRAVLVCFKLVAWNLLNPEAFHKFNYTHHCIAWKSHLAHHTNVHDTSLQPALTRDSSIESIEIGMFRFISACSAGRHLTKSCLVVLHRSSSVTKLERLQRLCQRLEQLQSRVRCPRLEFFTVGSETFKLPLKAVGPPADKPCRQELEYLVGFFDGDGSVSLIRGSGRIRLQIDQNVDSARVLLRYRRALGGSVIRSCDSNGRKKACLKWHTYGTQAASWLGSIASMKQAQLAIAATGVVPLGDRDVVAEKLIELKKHTCAPAKVECSWSYFAGLFDADGTIVVTSAQVSINLRVTQKNPFGLSHLLGFFAPARSNVLAIISYWAMCHTAVHRVVGLQKVFGVAAGERAFCEKGAGGACLDTDRGEPQRSTWNDV